MMCTMPFSFKVLWSPIVEFYHFEWAGKRKSWIVPTQLVMSAFLVFISVQLEPLIEEKKTYTVAGTLMALIFVTTC